MSQESTEVKVLLFEVGGCVYGADASQVLRIDRPDSEAAVLHSLGPLRAQARALVFQRGSGEEQLKVDAVQGVKSVPLESLRPLPRAARGDSYAVGVWLDGNRPVLLLDLWRIHGPGTQ